MNLYYFVQKYLDRKDDYNFGIAWEQKFMGRISKIISIIFIIYVMIVIGFGILINGNGGFLLALLSMGTMGILLGYFLFVQFIRFLAINNERYMRIKMNQQENTFNYDNVIE